VAKTAVLHAISHDLRSPLTAITTAAGRPRRSGAGADDRADLVSVIGVESSRLARMVDDLLDLSKIEAGAVEPQPDWCDLHDVLGSAAAAIADHPVELALDPDLPLVRGRPGPARARVRQPAGERGRFSPHNAPVRVTAAVGGGSVTVTVADRGPRRRRRPSQPRVRTVLPAPARAAAPASAWPSAAASSKPTAAAYGLLAAPEGAAFAVSIPLVEQPAPAPWTARILVVDDEPQILRGLRVVLRTAGYDVATAQTKAEALDASPCARRTRCFSTWCFPDGSGVDVCREVRRWSGLPIIVLSAVGDEREKVRALDVGRRRLRHQALRTEELLARLRAVIRRSAEAAGEPAVSVGDLEIDLADRRVRRAGEEIHLTPIEFDLVAALARHHGKLVTHRALLQEVWGPGTPTRPTTCASTSRTSAPSSSPIRAAALRAHRPRGRLPPGRSGALAPPLRRPSGSLAHA